MKQTSKVSKIKTLMRDKRGAMALTMAFALPAFIGMVGLGVDATNWYLSKRKVQTAVDASAIAGALTYSYTEEKPDAISAAVQSATRNEFVDGGDNTLVINIPPTTGAFTGDDRAVEVLGTQDQTLYLASVVFSGAVEVPARAVATMQVVESEHCILGLAEEDASVYFTGTADVDVGCGVAANSHSDNAITIWGNADVAATPVSAVGDIDIGGNADLLTNAPLRTFQSPFIDPYGPEGANLQLPASVNGACDHDRFKAQGTVTLNPGKYCRGLDVTNADVTFNPGVYVIYRGTFKTTGTSTMFGDGVTFVLSGTGSDYANVEWSGGTIADLTAPDDGPYEGVLFFQDPAAPSFQGSSYRDNKFNGGSNLDLTGALYFPKQQVTYNGGASIAGSCLQIVAMQVTFTGNGALGNNCPADMTLPPILTLRVRLVE